MKRLREIMGAALLLLAPALAFAGAEGEGAGAAPDTLSAPGVYPISDALITVTALGNVDARIQDITTNYAVTWLEEQTNLHVEWDVVTGADAGQKINLVLAAGSDLPDMIVNSGITTEQQFLYGSQGYLAPLEGLIEEHTVDIKRVFAEDPLVPRQLTAPDGHIYALSERPVAYHSTLSQKLWINVEWLERLGLEMPTTTAELRSVLEAFRDQDANGNGDPNDEIPYSGLINYWRSRPGAFVMNAFIYDDGFGDPTNSHRMVVNGGIISPAFTTGEWRQGLSFLHGLYRDGLFDGEAFVMDRSQLHTLNNGGVEGPARVGAHQAGVPWGALAPQGTMHRQYRAVPPLTGPNGAQFTGHYPKNQRGSKFSLTTAASDLEQAAIIKYFDFVHRPGASRMVPFFGPEGEGWRWAEAGEMAYTGETALWKQINVFNTAHNHLVGHMYPNYFEEGFFDRQVPVSDDPLAIEPRLYWESLDKYEGHQPDEIVRPLIHGFDEGREYGQLRAPIKEFVDQSFARFVTGDLDVNADADWNNYLAQLEALKVDRFVELLQIAYDRMYR